MTASPDQVVPFAIGGGAVRGRLVRLGPTLDAILHGYPLPVAALLAETIVLAAALAAQIKYDGVFTLQAQGAGPVTLLVADVTSAGHIRAHARYNPDKLAGLTVEGHASVPHLLGGGHLAFTVDQGPDTERYQGIVELIGHTLEECARVYFKQSEQLDTEVEAAVRPPSDGAGWAGSALLIQRMPAGSGNAPILVAEDAEEGWRRAVILLGSVTAAEMLDPALTPDQLLHRLYHAEQLQVFEAKPLEARCRCSRERVMGALASIAADELATLADAGGNIVVTCEFCRAEHTIAVTELAHPRP
ncbi:Hsp33 family molecular chaperone HslO [Magnetospirillum sp. SS-4]|uniref:Hsp33 family molecular chaperone HslO n=1 Tax=Magnetospirillum sp. SS-4 TaxID=2681465 RepID=UPI00137E2A75|nr:Hsp33 family molecular chaperone HslO [Magnetospirillum sp. SS-4]CAA7612970.1 33 kDa chaperonin [Magnetospirillum sp. SS-4]